MWIEHNETIPEKYERKYTYVLAPTGQARNQT